jgi:hypothetical protein
MLYRQDEKTLDRFFGSPAAGETRIGALNRRVAAVVKPPLILAAF